jgi:hypothetical protein
MEKTAIVTSRTFKNEFKGANGTLYNFDVVMDNGDLGQYSSTKQEPSSFVPTKEQKYTVEIKSGTSKAGKDYSFNVLKPVKEASFGFGGGKSFKKDSFTQAIILAQSSFAKSVDLVVAGKLELGQLQAAAEKLMAQQIESAIKFKDQIKAETEKE